LAVAVIYLFHLGFYLPRRIGKRGAFRRAHTLSLTAEKLNRDAEAAEQSAKAARALAAKLIEAAELAKKTLPERDALRIQQEDAAAKGCKAADDTEADALVARAKAAEKRAEADNLQEASEAALERTPGQFYIELGVGAVTLMVFPPLINGAIRHLDPISVLILIGIAAGVAIVSLITYVATDRFLWFGVVAFVTVGIYIGSATYFSTTKNPKVEPAAALRAGRPPVVGIYIADTASNLYLGSFANEERTPRLLVIPRTQVTDLAVGPLVNPGAAPKRAAELALDRCEQKIEVAKTETEPASFKPACTGEEEEALEELRG
jgi:hypothetical protein